MSDKTVYNAFGQPVREPLDHTIPGFDRSKILNPIVVADEDAPGTTKVMFEEIDLRSFIAEAANNTGLEYVLRMMKAGQIRPEDIADDGKHGLDLTGVPSYIGDVKNMSDKAVGEASSTLEKLGIDPSKSYSEEELQKVIAEALKPYFVKEEKPTEE